MVDSVQIKLDKTGVLIFRLRGKHMSFLTHEPDPDNAGVGNLCMLQVSCS